MGLFGYSFFEEKAIQAVHIDRNKDRLFLVRGTLEDIISGKEDYILQIDGFIGGSFVYFRLSANENLITDLVSNGIQKYDDIAVIAQFKKIQKLTFEVSPIGEELDLSISDTLVFLGECKAFMKIP